MKGNKMSAILAILLMLSGALLVPHSFANMPQVVGTRADAVQTNVVPTGLVNASYTYPTMQSGSSFYVYIDVINVTQLASYQVGFTFNQTVLQVTNVTDGLFLTTGVPGSKKGNSEGAFDNTTGICSAYAWYLLDAAYNKTGSGHLMKVGFKIASFSPPYTGVYPGSPESMIHFNTTTTDATALILIDSDFFTQITPLNNHVYDGWFTLAVVPTLPTCSFVITPNPVYWNITHPQTFTGTATPGSIGYGLPIPIDKYFWDFGDLNTAITGSNIIIHTYVNAGKFIVTLKVNDTGGRYSAIVNSENASVLYLRKPTAIVEANPLSLSYLYPSQAVPGSTFTAYAVVANVTNLYSFQLGFTFNHAALKVLSVVEGGLLSNNGADSILTFNGTIDNVAGQVSAYAFALTDPMKAKSVSGSATGRLLKVGFQINPALWPPFTGFYPGSPVTMMHFSNASGSDIQLILWDNSTLSDITPNMGCIFDGLFTLQVTGALLPTAVFSIVPNPVYIATTQTFYSGASIPGYNGYATVPIVSYNWDFGDGVKFCTPSTIMTHTYATTGTKHVKLIVQGADGINSTAVIHDAIVNPRPYGCFIDLTTQTWRYIDPTWLVDVSNGLGYGTGAELFRPSDYVQLFANVTYNGDEVAGQLVSFQVLDVVDNVVLTGTAISNANGIAEYDFRIPWPMPIVTIEFGAWHAVATWECGAMTGQPPYAVTQSDTLGFIVGWGLWISSISLDRVSYDKILHPWVTVKINVQNDYLVKVRALATASIYDDLMVPIGGPAVVLQDFYPGPTLVTFSPLLIQEWAFVGTGRAKANLFTTWPWLSGTAFCPEVTKTFTITKS